MSRRWCEHCRDHFDVDHFDAESGLHGVGAEYGPYGKLLAAADRVVELEAALGAIRDYAEVKANVAAQHSDEEAGTLRVIAGMSRDALTGDVT